MTRAAFLVCPIGGALDMDQDRATALHEAVRLHDAIGDLGEQLGVDINATIVRDETAVLDTAEVFLAWLRGPVRLVLAFGQVRNQSTMLPTGNTNAGGNMAQLHDNEQVDVTVSAVDAKGFETADALTYVSADESVATVVGATDEDSHTATIVAGNPGSTTVTITDPTAIDPATGNPLFVTVAVDVVAAGAVTLNVVEGTPVPQP